MNQHHSPGNQGKLYKWEKWTQVRLVSRTEILQSMVIMVQRTWKRGGNMLTFWYTMHQTFMDWGHMLRMQDKFNITHKLLVKQKMSWDWLSVENVQFHSQAVGDRNNTMRQPFTKYANHSLAVGHRKRWDKTAYYKCATCVTHILLVIGKDVIRQSFTKCTIYSQAVDQGKDVIRLPFGECEMSFTSCWS